MLFVRRAADEMQDAPTSIMLKYLQVSGIRAYSSTFPLTVSQALPLYPRVQTKCKDILESLLDGRHHLQFTRLVKLL